MWAQRARDWGPLGGGRGSPCSKAPMSGRPSLTRSARPGIATPLSRSLCATGRDQSGPGTENCSSASEHQKPARQAADARNAAPSAGTHGNAWPKRGAHRGSAVRTTAGSLDSACGSRPASQGRLVAVHASVTSSAWGPATGLCWCSARELRALFPWTPCSCSAS